MTGWTLLIWVQRSRVIGKCWGSWGCYALPCPCDHYLASTACTRTCRHRTDMLTSWPNAVILVLSVAASLQNKLQWKKVYQKYVRNSQIVIICVQNYLSVRHFNLPSCMTYLHTNMWHMHAECFMPFNSCVTILHLFDVSFYVVSSQWKSMLIHSYIFCEKSTKNQHIDRLTLLHIHMNLKVLNFFPSVAKRLKTLNLIREDKYNSQT